MYGKKIHAEVQNTPLSYNNSLILSNPEDKGIKKED